MKSTFRLFAFSVLLTLSCMLFQKNSYAITIGINQCPHLGASEPAPAGLAYLHTPSAIYDSTANKTILAFQKTDLGIYVMWYDHATGQGSAPVYLGAGLGTSDVHGGPTIGTDSSGYLHVFGGCHATALKHWKSNSIHNPQAWTAQSNIGTDITYPFCIFFNSKLYLIYRRGASGAGSWYYSNEDNFATETQVLDGGAESLYVGNVSTDGTFLYINWIRNDLLSTRLNPGVAKFDGTNWKKMDGTNYTLPISSAADEHAVATDNKQTQTWDIQANSDGKIYLSYTKRDSTETEAAGWIGASKQYVAVYSGGTWTSYQVATCNHLFDRIYLDLISTTTIDAYLEQGGIDDGTAWNRGGVIMRYRSTNSGQTWTYQETISNSSEQDGMIQLVRNNHSAIKGFYSWGNSSPSWIRSWPTNIAFTYTGSTLTGSITGS